MEMATLRAAVIGAGVAAAVAHAGPGVTAIAPLRRRCFRGLAGAGAADHVALTFDDGPDPRFTPRLLDILGSRRTHATFFLLGSRSEEHTSELQSRRDLVCRLLLEKKKQ